MLSPVFCSLLAWLHSSALSLSLRSSPFHENVLTFLPKMQISISISRPALSFLVFWDRCLVQRPCKRRLSWIDQRCSKSSRFLSSSSSSSFAEHGDPDCPRGWVRSLAIYSNVWVSGNMFEVALRVFHQIGKWFYPLIEWRASSGRGKLRVFLFGCSRIIIEVGGFDSRIPGHLRFKFFSIFG